VLSTNLSLKVRPKNSIVLKWQLARVFGLFGEFHTSELVSSFNELQSVESSTGMYCNFVEKTENLGNLPFNKGDQIFRTDFQRYIRTQHKKYIIWKTSIKGLYLIKLKRKLVFYDLKRISPIVDRINFDLTELPLNIFCFQ